MKSINHLIDQLAENQISVQLTEDGNNLKINVAKGVQIQPEIIEQLKLSKGEIISFLQNAPVETVFTHIEPVSPQSDYESSSFQKRIWLSEQMADHQAANNLFQGYYLSDLDCRIFEETFHQLIDRHESLRTTFRLAGEELRQVIHPAAEFRVELARIDVRHRANAGQSVEEIAEEVAHFSFDLANGPLIKAVLVQLEDNRHLFLLTIHHIIADAWSLDVVIREIFALYNAAIRGEQYPLEALRIQFKDYVAWKNQSLKKGGTGHQREYWLRQLEKPLPILDLPTDFRRPDHQTFDGDLQDVTLSTEQLQRLKKLAHQENTSLFVILLATFKMLLYKYSGQKDLIVGTPVAGRDHFDLEDQIGFYVNTLALRAEVEPEATFGNFLKRVHDATFSAYKHQDYPFDELLQELPLERNPVRSPLFDVMFVLNNSISQGHHAVEMEGVQMQPFLHKLRVSKFDLTMASYIENGALTVGLEYNTNLFTAERVRQMLRHYVNLLERLPESIAQPVQQLNLLDDVEKNTLLNDFNRTEQGFPTNTLHGMFEAQVVLTPNAKAAVYEGKELTYQELNEKANQLAHFLRDQIGVKPNDMVGLILDTSLWHPITLFGILKAGTAYVPIDPDYPTERITYILEEVAVKCLLMQTKKMTAQDVSDQYAPLVLEDIWNEVATYPITNPTRVNRPDHLAYIIFTSGSTGRPKGVMVPHKGVVNTLSWRKMYYNFGQGDAHLQMFSYAFDGSVTDTYSSLISGGTLVIPDGAKRSDLQYLASLMRQESVTHFIAIPSLYKILLEEITDALGTLKGVTVAGEAIGRDILELHYQLLPEVGLYNEYGPTENSVCSSATKLALDEAITIGHPISNVKVYILSEQLELLPPGVAGEICVAGSGLALGYWNKPELTAEKMVDNPFAEEGFERIYRTGDIGRWTNNGQIEFHGRKDDQTKIRGFRIELGEIENALLKLESINTVAVLVREIDDFKHLVAYVTSEVSLDEEMLTQQLRASLPDYMIPSFFVSMEVLPVTTTGKLDKKALPLPEAAAGKAGRYVSPTNEKEQMIIEVCEWVLGKKGIGTNDNFFHLGGDSIKAIQISSRLSGMGYKLEVREIMKQPVLKKLAQALEVLEQQADQSLVVGEFPLTPIQEAFFNTPHQVPGHFNQAVMLFSADGFEEETIRAIFQKIQLHHDALRSTFRSIDGRMMQVIHGEEYPLSLQVFDWRADKVAEDQLANEVEKVQGSIELESGPLCKLALFKMKDGDRLLMVVHHLVIDGVSWRILFEDFGQLYQQYQRGQVLELPLKTTAFSEWGKQLSKFAGTDEVLEEKAYWIQHLEQKADWIPSDDSIEENRVEDTATVAVSLDQEMTQLLLTEAHQAFNTEVNDLLLLALARTLCRKWNGERYWITLESHGREQLFEEDNVSRTIGWFTSTYPVLLAAPEDRDMRQQIIETKEMLRRVPNNGIGYNILKYLSANQPAFEADVQPQVLFNYLGQFDQDVANTAFAIAEEHSGAASAAANDRGVDLDISGMVTGHQLEINFGYNHKQFKRKTIASLAQSFVAELGRIIEFCRAQEHPVLTSSDVSLSSLPQGTLDELTQQYGIEDIYALSPLQEGMLFHALLDGQSDAYFAQTSYKVIGDVDKDLVVQTLDQLMKRHAVLRTIFDHESADQAIQVVLKQRAVEFIYKDYRGEKEQDKRVKNYREQDRKRSFDLKRDSLMRVSLLQLGEGVFEFVWSYHHIIMDGWCISILTNEFFQIYNGLLNGREVSLEPIPPYQTYIEWLERQKKSDALKHWHEYLLGFEEGTGLPQLNLQPNPEKGFQREDLHVELKKDKTTALQELAARYEVTLNNLIQTIWGLLLSKYNNRRDVLFGAVVSGRPAEMKQVESMVGLFINTIPVRIQYADDSSFLTTVRNVQHNSFTNESYHYCQLAELQSLTDLGKDLINHVLVFENYPIEEQISQNNEGSKKTLALEISDVTVFEQTNYDFELAVAPGENLHFHFVFNGQIYDRRTVENIAEQIEQVIDQLLTNADLCVGEIDVLTTKDKQQLLIDFNQTIEDYQINRPISEYFEQEVVQHADEIAVIHNRETITYRDLNAKANQIAHLLHAKGIGKNDFVGVFMDRGVDLVVAMMAILKCGAIYVPLDQKNPIKRSRWLIEKSELKAIFTEYSTLCQQAELVKGHDHLHYALCFDKVELPLNIDTEELGIEVLGAGTFAQQSVENLNLKISVEDWAYMLFTSGSTGMPKGAILKHDGVINHIVAEFQALQLPDGFRFLQSANISSDISVWQILAPLLKGGAPVVIDQQDLLNYETLVSTMQENRVNIVEFVPSFLKGFIEYLTEFSEERPNLPDLQWMMMVGEEVPVDLVNQWLTLYPHCGVLNGYGPAEASDDITQFVTHQPIVGYKKTPIGTPLANLNIFIVDEQMRLLPIGSIGEIVVSGIGVGGGYWKDPEKTAANFVVNPFEGTLGETIYKTGDLGRWLLDGNLEFYGRKDKQVKIRGFRVESGEVEAVLREHEDITDAVVCPRTDRKGQKYLAAYLILKDEESTNEWLKELRAFLHKRLPEYMIPSAYVFMEKFPINLSDKIDYKALPDPEETAFVGEKYVAPRTEQEKVLISICQRILGKEALSMEDNFFMAGGDSIKAVQIVSRLGREGYRLEVKEVMQYPVFNKMAQQLRTKIAVADQAEVKGEIPSLPIQRMFFTTPHQNFHHYNQAVVLKLKNRIKLETVEAIFSKLQEHHDALRMVYVNEGSWHQINKGILEYPNVHVQEYDLTEIAAPMQELEAAANKMQQSFDLNSGPLFKGALFHLKDEDQLLIVAHHLIMDGVSWRILFEDIETLYTQYENNSALQLPLKTESFKTWAEKLQEIAKEDRLKAEIPHWEMVQKRIPDAQLAKDFENADNKVADADVVSFKLNPETTGLLLSRAHEHFNTEINDLLLSGLGLGVKSTWGLGQIAVALESHGRSSELMDLDISRTVGWFTNVYPVLVDARAENLLDVLIGVKENLRSIPNQGMGYGLLYRMNGEGLVTKPEIQFNYLGQLDDGVENDFFMLSQDGGEGLTTALDNDREFVLDINGMVVDRQLELSIGYNKNQFKEDTIQRFATAFQTSLERLIEACCNQPKRVLTPSDMAFKGLEMSQLEQLSKQFEIENIYPLAPLQEGMLFHALYDEGGHSYFDQISYRLSGQLDLALVEESLNTLMDRYEVLRAAIDHQTAGQPFQVIVANRRIGFEYRDIRHLNNAEQDRFINDFREADKNRDFDLTKEVLMRVAVLQINEKIYELIWSHHHIIMDGWCVGVLIEEFFEIYNALAAGRDPQLSPVRSYGIYLDWLQRQSKESAKAYWMTYLEGFEGSTGIPQYCLADEKVDYLHQEHAVEFSKANTEKLSALAAKYNVTLNSLIQTIWSLVLGRYNDQSDVVFGSVVSGRPAEIMEVESMIGLFINTVPVRVKYEEDETFTTLLQRVQQSGMTSEPYHYTQLADIQTYKGNNQSLFDHILVFENYPVSGYVEGLNDEKATSLTLEISDVEIFEQTNYNFEIDIIPGEQLKLQFIYNGNVYEDQVVGNIGAQIESVVDQILINPEMPLAQIATLTQSERQLLLEEFNATAVDFGIHAPIGVGFSRQAALTPDALAVRHSGDELSYAMLDNLSNQLAHLLRSRGIGRGDFVGVHLERSKEVVIAMLSILKSGAAYVPLDKMNPAKRTEWLINRSSVKAVFTDVATLKSGEIDFAGLSGLACVIVQEAISEEILVNGLDILSQQDYKNLSTALPENENELGDTAYMLFTSGSTGMPKGALLHHAGVLNHIYAEYTSLNLSDGFGFLQSANLASDISVWQLVGPLLKGGSTVIIDRFDLLEYARLMEVISESGVELIELVPSYVRGLIDYLQDQEELPALPHLRWLMLSGEEAPVRLINDWLSLYPEVGIANGYGPAEASDDVTQYQTHSLLSETERTPIGRPLANVQIYILDKDQELLPLGSIGEIAIGGIGVGSGYWEDEARTAASFVDNPYAATPGERLYLTGDLGRWRWDGTLEFYGRRDSQVKIRGYRVELGEIEQILGDHPQVSEAVVSIRKRDNGESYLAGYVIVEGGESSALVLNGLRSYMQSQLPSHMVPDAYVEVEDFPRNLSDKIDHQSLPEPEGLSSKENYTAPQTAEEQELAIIWQELLLVDRVSIDRDFFELGGNSLKAIQLVSRIYKSLGVELSVREVFSAVTIRDQAQLIAGGARNTYAQIEALGEQPYYEVSHSQKRLWILDQFEEDQIAYNMPGAYILEGPLDVSGFRGALEDVVGRHEILRTVFEEVEGRVMQRVIPMEALGFEVSYEEWQGQIDGDRLQALAELSASHVFDLSQGPLLRASLIKLGEEQYLFLLNLHHIISDGWSEEVLVSEVFHYYGCRKSGEASTLPALRVQYKDYAAWQHGQLQGAKLESHKAYWQSQFSGSIPVLDLVGSYPRPAVQTFEGRNVYRELSEANSEGLRRLSKEKGASLFMLLMSSLKALFYKYTGQEDIVLGTVVAGRNHADLERQIGFYVNTLGLRTQFSGQESFEELLSRVREVTLGGYDHQEYPFDLLVEQLDVDRDMSRSPLFDVVVVLQDTSLGEVGDLEGITIKGVETTERISKFDLSIEFDQTASGNLSIDINYNTSIYDSSYIVQLLDHYEELLSSILNAPEQSLKDLKYVGSAEAAKLQEEWNVTSVSYPNERSVQEVFEAQVKQTPQAIAVSYEGKTLSYEALNERSNQVAHYLRQTYGIVADDKIGLMVDRSEWYAVLLLGILKAGGAYVPLDRNYPSSRLKWMAEDTSLKVMITDREEWLDISQERLSDLLQKSEAYPVENPTNENSSRDLAYVMYTSGSTGKPKGVMIEHRSIVRLVKGANYVELDQTTRILQTGSLSFDAMTFEVWGALLNGGSLYLMPQEKLLDAVHMGKAIAEHGITTMWLTSSWYNQVVDLSPELFRPLQQLLIGGEKLSEVHVKKVLDVNPNLVLINGYGPTENTTFSCCYPIGEVGRQSIPIGRPISNSTAYVLDEAGNLCGIGVVGELWVGGDGLARGYLNREELTAEKFVQTSFGRLYRTGDLARWTPEGHIAFMGRRDAQVKLRGFRIELGEIEDALTQYEGVDQAAVVMLSEESGSKYLVGYTVGGATAEALRQYLSDRLPDYMIPSYFINLPILPLTANGKLDRAALPQPDHSARSKAIIAPRTAAEQQMLELWQEVLGIEEIGVKDNFFSQGGHSLKAVQLISRIYRSFEVKVDLRDIFTHATIERLTEKVGSMSQQAYQQIEKIAEQADYELSHAQKRLWVLDQMGEVGAAYNMSWAYSMKDVDIQAMSKAFSTLVARHEILRTTFISKEGNPRQKVHSPESFAFKVGYQNLKGQSASAYTIGQQVRDLAATKFDLSQGPLIKVDILKLEEGEYILSLVLHHIISDGWSMQVLLEEVLALYDALRQGKTAALPDLRIQYKDYAAWQQQQLQGSQLEHYRTYWLEQFSGQLNLWELPRDFNRPAKQTFNGRNLSFTLDEETTQALKQLSQNNESTLFITFLALVKVFLYRYTQQGDIIVGTSVPGREDKDLESQIGFYVNMLVLRNQVAGDLNFPVFLKKVRQNTLAAFEHQLYPFDQLISDLKLERDPSRNPLFDIVVASLGVPGDNWEDQVGQKLSGANIQVESFDIDEDDADQSKQDLRIGYMDLGTQMMIELRYNPDLFKKERIEIMKQFLLRMIQDIVGDPNRRIDDFEFTTGFEDTNEEAVFEGDFEF